MDTIREILTVKLDRGKLVMLPTGKYAHLQLGYAVTAYKAQGLTTENAFVLLGGPNQ